MAGTLCAVVRFCGRLTLLLAVFCFCAAECRTAQSTVTTLIFPAQPIAHDTAVTLTATVSANGGPVTPGTVTFCRADVQHCEAPFVFGTAQLRPDGTASVKLVPGIGTYSIQAVFAGTNAYTASTSAAQTLTVAGTYPTTTLAASQNGNELALTATVTRNGNSASVLGGKVSFLDASNGNAAIGTAALGAPTVSESFNPQVSYGVGGNAVTVGVLTGMGFQTSRMRSVLAAPLQSSSVTATAEYCWCSRVQRRVALRDREPC